MASESDPLQLILAELTSIKASNAALQQELAEQREELAFFRQQMKGGQTSEVNSSPSQTTPISIRTPSEPPLSKSDRLPDPPAFNGRQKDLPAFIRKLQYKLEGNADRFPTERSRLLYAHSRLDRDVTSLIDPLMDTDVCNVDQFIKFLKATYGDPNKEMTALSKLYNLRQGKRSFTAHFAEFRRLAADTGLNEIGLIASLRSSLSLELQRAMVGESLPSNLNTYANLIATYDNNMRFLPARALTPYRAQTTPITTHDPNAMEVDSSYAPAGTREREDRLRKGLCFKCGKHGHISRNCPVPLPSARSNSVHSPTRPRSGSASTKSSSHRSRRSRSRSRSQRNLRKDSSRS